jgi:thioredoxin 1
MTADYAAQEPTRAEVDALAGRVLVEFGAPWCPHCQAVQQSLAAALGERPDVKHVKVEDGKGQPLGRSFGVKLWPNLVFMRDGRVVMQLARPTPAELADGFESLDASSPARSSFLHESL